MDKECKKHLDDIGFSEQLVKEVGLVGENESFNDLISGKSSLITGNQKKGDKPSSVKPKNKKE